MAVPKTHVYKVYRAGVFLGVLQNVRSPLEFTWDINSAGTMINVQVAISTDVAGNANDALLDEAGNILTDEAGNSLLTERQPDVVGDSNDSILLRNNNQIKVYEYSDYWPNGKIMFSGKIERLEAKYGSKNSEEIVTAIVYSDASELVNYIVQDAA